MEVEPGFGTRCDIKETRSRLEPMPRSALTFLSYGKPPIVEGGLQGKEARRWACGITSKNNREGLDAKTLDAQLRQILVAGLACSPFEAEAVLGAVQEVYAPFFHGPDSGTPRPGQITLVALAAEEPAGKPVADCQKRTVALTLHRGSSDDRLLHELGLRDFRRQQALSQGALLTREDLACRIFLVGLRTLSRDLAWLRAHDERPLRSTRHDTGWRSSGWRWRAKPPPRSAPSCAILPRRWRTIWGPSRAAPSCIAKGWKPARWPFCSAAGGAW